MNSCSNFPDLGYVFSATRSFLNHDRQFEVCNVLRPTRPATLHGPHLRPKTLYCELTSDGVIHIHSAFTPYLLKCQCRTCQINHTGHSVVNELKAVGCLYPLSNQGIVQSYELPFHWTTLPCEISEKPITLCTVNPTWPTPNAQYNSSFFENLHFDNGLLRCGVDDREQVPVGRPVVSNPQTTGTSTVIPGTCDRPRDILTTQWVQSQIPDTSNATPTPSTARPAAVSILRPFPVRPLIATSVPINVNPLSRADGPAISLDLHDTHRPEAATQTLRRSSPTDSDEPQRSSIDPQSSLESDDSTQYHTLTRV